jgi:hypothetical protein
MSLIAIPTADEYPVDLKPERAGAMRFELPEIDHDRLPVPVGFRLLVLPVRPPKATNSGIQLVTESIQHMQIMRTTGVILRAGPLAFSEKRGWAPGYREELGLSGDVPNETRWVQFQAHSGMDVLCASKDGSEQVTLKYLNDADILGLFTNPADIEPFTLLI